MKVTWLGQAGLMFEYGGKAVIVDPYLSNSVEKINPDNYRRVPVCEKFLKVKPDIIVLTHNHLDHTDPDTLKYYLSEDSGVTVLAPDGAWQQARGFGGINNNYVMLNRHSQWTDGDFVFKAVRAEHSDRAAIGVILSAGGKNYYITGDTLYNDEIFSDIGESIYALFLPINGVGNNMNIEDAQKFAQKIGAFKTVPVHFGMFDEINPAGFRCGGAVIPEIYKEIQL